MQPFSYSSSAALHEKLALYNFEDKITQSHSQQH